MGSIIAVFNLLALLCGIGLLVCVALVVFGSLIKGETNDLRHDPRRRLQMLNRFSRSKN